MSQSIVDWFDITNLKHLRAWQALQETGFWPHGFTPAGVTFPALWHVAILNKMAELYVETTLAQSEAKELGPPATMEERLEREEKRLVGKKVQWTKRGMAIARVRHPRQLLDGCRVASVFIDHLNTIAARFDDGGWSGETETTLEPIE